MPVKLRALDRNPPFTYRLRNSPNVVIETITSNEREVTMVQDPTNIWWDITSNDGNTVSGSVDSVTRNILKTIWNGIATPNGTVANHINSINAGVTLGLNSQSVEFDLRDMLSTDADFNNPIWTQHFNHINGAIQTPYDETVKHAKQTGVKLFIMLSANRPLERLNGYEGRTMFYGDADLMKRVGGSNVTGADSNGNPLVGSIMATAFRNYYKAIMLKFFTRYRNAINDGTIICVMPKMAQTAESHYEMDFVWNGGRTGDADGDYHINMISAFKAHLQSYLTVAQYNTKFGTSISSFNDITANYLGGNTSFASAIRKYWYWFRNEKLAEFYEEMWNYILANVVGLTRTAAAGIDMGSLSDGQGKHRGCYNSGRMIKHPFVMMIKSNDSTDFPALWCITLLASLAETYNCIARVEPSPINVTQAMNNGGFNEYIGLAKANNVGISFIEQYHINPTGLTNVVNIHNLPNYTTKTARDVIKADGTICAYNTSLSKLIGDGGAWHGSPSINTEFNALNCGPNTVKLITITDDIGDTT